MISSVLPAANDHQDDLHRSFERARCLVTGGAGFIGSNLTRRLLDLGAHVTVLDNFSTGRRENLPEHSNLTIVESDVGTCDRLEQLASRVRYVFHMAAQVGNIKSIA